MSMELDRMRSLNYEDGRAFLTENPLAVPLFERLKKDCPHVPSRDIVALFHLRNEELVRATAHRLEYNAARRAGAEDAVPDAGDARAP